MAGFGEDLDVVVVKRKDTFHPNTHFFSEDEMNEVFSADGRDAYLYKQAERELAFQREQAKILRQFEAMRTSIYQ